MTPDFPTPKSFTKAVLEGKGPDAVLEARRRRAKAENPEILLCSCYFVAPLPKRWKLFICHRSSATATVGWIEAFWRESVVPELAKAWSRAKLDPAEAVSLAERLVPLANAFPRGVVASVAGALEIWYGDGVESWMGIRPRQIEVALDSKQDWQWRLEPELSCDPAGVDVAMKALELKQRWGNPLSREPERGE